MYFSWWFKSQNTITQSATSAELHKAFTITTKESNCNKHSSSRANKSYNTSSRDNRWFWPIQPNLSSFIVTMAPSDAHPQPALDENIRDPNETTTQHIFRLFPAPPLPASSGRKSEPKEASATQAQMKTRYLWGYVSVGARNIKIGKNVVIRDTNLNRLTAAMLMLLSGHSFQRFAAPKVTA